MLNIHTSVQKLIQHSECDYDLVYNWNLKQKKDIVRRNKEYFQLEDFAKNQW